MNGINYSTLMGNTGFFTNKNVKDDMKSDSLKGKGKLVGGKEDAKKAVNSDKDTFERSNGTREVKAGYDRPRMINRTNEDSENTSNAEKYKKLDSNGIQEGIKLSDNAKKLLDELREKYGDKMEISVAEWDSDEQQDYYAQGCKKDYSVLINPEALEKMAEDEELRAKYESVLGSVSEDFDKITEELGEDAEKVKGFSISIDKDGKVSYTLQLLKDMEANSANNAKEAKKAQEAAVVKKREEKKKAEKERMEKLEEKRAEEKEQYETITASSIEELIKAVKEKLHPVTDENEELIAVEKKASEDGAVVMNE